MPVQHEDVFEMLPIPRVEANWRALAATQTLSQVANRSKVVLMLGTVGSGKSTTAAIQLGAEFQADEHEKLQLVHCSVETPASSHQATESHTLQPAVFTSDTSDVAYIDLAGLNEDRQGLELWTKAMLQCVLDSSRTIKAIVVCLKANERPGRERGGTFPHLVRELSHMFPSLDSQELSSDDLPAIASSFVFVIKNDESITMSTDRLRREAKEHCKDLDGTIEGVKQDLRDALAPRSTKQDARSALSPMKACQGLRKALGPRTAQDLDAANQETVKKCRATLEEMEAQRIITLAFLRALDEDRVYVSTPSTPSLCRQQRHGIDAMIARAAVIDEETAKAYTMARQQNWASLQFLQKLALLCQETAAPMNRLVDILKDLEKIGSSDYHAFIERQGWKALLENKQKATTKAIREQKAVIKELKADITRLESNKAEEHIDDIRVSLRRNNNWFSRHFDFGRETYNYEFDGSADDGKRCQVYDTYEVSARGKENASVQAPTHEPKEGKLELTLLSDQGYGLNHRIQVLVAANKLNSTLVLVEKLRDELTQAEAKLQTLTALKDRLEVCGDKPALLKVLFDHLAPLLESKKGVLRVLETPYTCLDFPAPKQQVRQILTQFESITPEHVRRGLATLVALFLPCIEKSQLDSSSKKMLHGFSSLHRDVEELSKALSTEGASSSFGASAADVPPLRSGAAVSEPVLNTMESAKAKLREVTGNVRNYTARWMRSKLQQPDTLEIGVALVVAGLTVLLSAQLSPARMVLSMLLMAAGAVLVTQALRLTFEQERASLHATVNNCVQKLEVAREQSLGEARDCMAEVSQQLSHCIQAIDIHVRADTRDFRFDFRDLVPW
eukprot:m.73988 g.73988  ORF g.73988 m.73988 type:complete len:847 (-) comp14401_c0_seq1:50-2590(-)